MLLTIVVPHVLLHLCFIDVLIIMTEDDIVE